VLATCRVLASVSRETLSHYIISMTRSASDILAVVLLLRECGVVVHPGAFYRVAEQGRIVVSLIGPADDFAEGMRRIASFTKESTQ